MVVLGVGVFISEHGTFLASAVASRDFCYGDWEKRGWKRMAISIELYKKI